MSTETLDGRGLNETLNKIREDQSRLEAVLDIMWRVADEKTYAKEPWFVDIHKAIAKVNDELLRIDRELEVLNRNISRMGVTS